MRVFSNPLAHFGKRIVILHVFSDPLAAGHNVEPPVRPRISVTDLAAAITQTDANHAVQDVAYEKEAHPEVTQILGAFKFIR